MRYIPIEEMSEMSEEDIDSLISLFDERGLPFDKENIIMWLRTPQVGICNLFNILRYRGIDTEPLYQCWIQPTVNYVFGLEEVVELFMKMYGNSKKSLIDKMVEQALK
jgi:hypothetical protein